MPLFMRYWRCSWVCTAKSFTRSGKNWWRILPPIFNEYYQTICGSAEEVGLHYISQLEETELAGKLAMSRERDRILGYTSSGIHKDELEMTLGGYLIRRVGSQGQNKTYLIALKLAQFAFLNKRGQTTPILLLDDIFDKLDASRVEQIIKLVSENGFGQILLRIRTGSIWMRSYWL